MHSPSPIKRRAKCASGARSPLAPKEPILGMRGYASLFSIVRIEFIVSGVTPEFPFKRLFNLIKMEVLAESFERYSPTPIA